MGPMSNGAVKGVGLGGEGEVVGKEGVERGDRKWMGEEERKGRGGKGEREKAKRGREREGQPKRSVPANKNLRLHPWLQLTQQPLNDKTVAST